MSDLRIKRKNLAADVVDATKMLLDNETAIRFKKFDGSEMQAIKLSASDKIVFAAALQCAVDPSVSDDLVRKGYLDSRFEQLIGSAPETLDTLQEIAAMLQGSDVGNLLQSLAGKADLEDGYVLLSQIPDLAISKITGLGSRLEGIEQDIQDAQSAISEIQGSESTPGSIAYAVKVEKDRAELAEQGLEDRLDIVQGSDSVEGSFAKAVKSEKDRAELAEQDLDGRLDTLEGLDSQVGSVAYAVKIEKDRAELAEQGLEDRLDIVQGSDSVEGSFAKAVKVEKDRAELAEQGLEDRLDIVQGSDSVEGSFAKAVKVEKDRAELAESGLSDRIDTKASQSDFENLDGYAQDIRSDHDALQIEVDQAKSDIDALEAAMPGKASVTVVDGIDGRLITAEGEIDQLQIDVDSKASQSDFDGLYSTVNTEHDARLDALDGDVSGLELGKLSKSGGTMSGELVMGGNKISDLMDPSLAQDAATKKFVQDQISLATGSGSSVQDALDAKADLVDGKIVQSQIPAIAIVDTFEAASQAEMLALSAAEQGDICIRSDLNKTFILASGLYSTLSNWKELKTPTDAVLSVNGQTGAVSLSKSDVGLGSVDNTSDLSKPISTATQGALDLKADQTSVTSSLAGKASTTLNNLGVTAFNADLLPSSNNARSLGSSSLGMSTVWSQNIKPPSSSAIMFINSGGLRSVSIAVSGNITLSAHGFVVNQLVYFSGVLPAELNNYTSYYIKAVVDANTFTISATLGGAAMTFAASSTPSVAVTQGLTVGAPGPSSMNIYGGKTMTVNPFYSASSGGAMSVNTTGANLTIGNPVVGTTTIQSTVSFTHGSQWNSFARSGTTIGNLNKYTDQDGVSMFGLWHQDAAGTPYSGINTDDKASVNSAGIKLRTGDATAGSYNSGEILIKTGASAGGSRGRVKIDGSYIDASSAKISNVAEPSDGSDAATKSFVEVKRDEAKTYADAGILVEKNRAEGVESGHKTRLDILEGIDSQSGSVAYAVKVEKDRAEAAELVLTNEKLSKSGGTMSGELAMGGNKVSGMAQPSADQDAATKKYVDDAIVGDREAYERARFVVDASMKSDGFVDLSHLAISGSISMFVGRLAYFPTGSEPDYSISVEGGVTRVSFLNALVSGDEELQVGDVIHICYARR